MRSVSVRLADLDRVKINLGIAGENEHTHVLFDCKKAFDQYPNATPFLIVTPPRGDIYPAVVTRDGDIVEWIVTDSDLIYHGNGKVQLQFKQGDIIMKSYEARTSIAISSEPTGTVPTPIQNWITQANAILASIPDDINAALAAAKASGEFDGADGVGIAAITLKSTVGLVDTYTITLTDGRDYDFTVTNGTPGQNGVGIQSIAKTSTVGLVDTYTVTLTNGQTYPFTVTNGQNGVEIDDTTPANNKVFSSAKVDEELTDVKTAIQGIERLHDNEPIQFEYTLERGAINSSGNPIDNSPGYQDEYYLNNSCRTNDFIDISSVNKLSVKLTRASGAPTPSGMFYTYINFYDSNKAFITREGGEGGTEIEIENIPTNTKYAKISFTFTRLQDVIDSELSGIDTSYVPEIVEVVKAIKDLKAGKEEIINYDYSLEKGAINSSGVPVDNSSPGDGYYTNSSCRTDEFIDISNAKSLNVKLTRSQDAQTPSGLFYTYLYYYNSLETFISRVGGEGVTEIKAGSIPDGTKYVKISFTFTRLQDVVKSSLTETKTIQNDIVIVQKVKRLDGLSITVPQKGIVLGDSISFGLWSYWDGNQRKNADDIYSDINKTAAPIRISDWLARYYGIPIDNIAKRGTGWVADTRNLGNAWVKAQATDFSEYDLVALCYGVNDYIQKSTMGSIENNTVGTIIGNMIHTLEKIYTDNPLAKVVVFSPLNTWGQYRDTSGATKVYYGDASTHYALGYDFNGTSFTLQALIDAMESVCDRYDVRHVVMSQGCTINVFNIKDILIDGLHPSQESMKSIASDMYHEMMFR